MKINIEIDCTPIEAREFMGLPDVSEANSAFVEKITGAMQGVQNPAQLQEYANALAPMGQMGMKLFKNAMESGMRAASGSKTAPSNKDAKD